MITTTDILRSALRHYRKWLENISEGSPDYKPLIIKRIGDQKKAEADGRWDALTEIIAQSKAKIGYGYRIELEPPAPNSRNNQSRLRALVFDTAADLLQYLDKTEEFEQFKRDCTLLDAIPALKTWRTANAYELVRYSPVWPQLLAVVRFFENNPRPDLPLRLLPIEGVDTKFIETHETVIRQLLDCVLPPELINKNYLKLARRYGLPEYMPLIECAWNDPGLSALFQSFSRVAFALDQLEKTPLPAARIMVVENRHAIHQLLQLHIPQCIVVFGGGFGAALLRCCTWLSQKELYYWGDLDAHGLAILSQFRQSFPHTIALLMDEATLAAFPQDHTVGKTYSGASPAHLNAQELSLFHRLNTTASRLEQERIPPAWIQAALNQYI